MECVMRPLLIGLRVCESCGQVRGTSRRGNVSACYCSGIECTWCGAVLRRPISDYYDRSGRSWWHVSYFGAMAHRCPAPADRRVGKQFLSRTPDPDVKEYQDAVTELAWQQIKSRGR